MFIPLLSILTALSFSASQYMVHDYEDSAYVDDSYTENTPLPVAYFDVIYDFTRYQTRDSQEFELQVQLSYMPYDISSYLLFTGGDSDGAGNYHAGVSWYDMTINYSCYVKCYAIYTSDAKHLMFEGSFDLMTDVSSSGGKSFTWTGGNPDLYGTHIGYSFSFTFFQYSSQVYNTYTNNDGVAWNDGYENGYVDGTIDKERYGNQQYQEGYTAGVAYASSSDDYAFLFGAIMDIGLLPVNIFLEMLNFDLFGINIGTFVLSILTIAMVFVLVKSITGSGGGD